jgi:hypothetical protein
MYKRCIKGDGTLFPTEIQAELLGGNGIVTEKIKHANLLSFTCLKSFLRLPSALSAKMRMI